MLSRGDSLIIMSAHAQTLLQRQRIFGQDEEKYKILHLRQKSFVFTTKSFVFAHMTELRHKHKLTELTFSIKCTLWSPKLQLTSDKHYQNFTLTYHF